MKSEDKMTIPDFQQLMIDYNVGVNLVASYELKRLDSDYCEE